MCSVNAQSLSSEVLTCLWTHSCTCELVYFLVPGMALRESVSFSLLLHPVPQPLSYYCQPEVFSHSVFKAHLTPPQECFLDLSCFSISQRVMLLSQRLVSLYGPVSVLTGSMLVRYLYLHLLGLFKESRYTWHGRHFTLLFQNPVKWSKLYHSVYSVSESEFIR